MLVLPRTGIFVFNGSTVEAWLEEAAIPEPFILGKVFGLWLELKGSPVLHGACLEVGDKAVGILGGSGAGKSTLSASLNAQGFPIITDDLIPLDFSHSPFLVHPGIPISRMWPDTGTRFIPDYESYDKVHPNYTKRKIPSIINGCSRFSDRSHQLSAIYILDRQLECEEIKVQTLPPANALMELVRMSYHPDIIRPLGLQSSRMKIFSELLHQVPVKKLSYPSGYDRLGDVHDFLLEQTGSTLAER